MLGRLTGFPIKCFGLGHWRLNLTWQIEPNVHFCVRSCIVDLFLYWRQCLFLKGIIAFMWETRWRESQKITIVGNSFCEFPHVGEVRGIERTHLCLCFVVCDRVACLSAHVCLCACMCELWTDAWKKASTGLWNFAFVAQMRYEVTSGVSHYEGMHCGRF